MQLQNSDFYGYRLDFPAALADRRFSMPPDLPFAAALVDGLVVPCSFRVRWITLLIQTSASGRA